MAGCACVVVLCCGREGVCVVQRDGGKGCGCAVRTETGRPRLALSYQSRHTRTPRHNPTTPRASAHTDREGVGSRVGHHLHPTDAIRHAPSAELRLQPDAQVSPREEARRIPAGLTQVEVTPFPQAAIPVRLPRRRAPVAAPLMCPVRAREVMRVHRGQLDRACALGHPTPYSHGQHQASDCVRCLVRHPALHQL
eukprot:1421044-Rhodomonas_salina.1